MSKTFYFRLAFDNLKKNAKMYIPFVLSCILTIMMYYMVSSLSMNPNMMNMIGGDVMQQILSLGIYVITVFAVIFLFYTNSFLIKRRKREFGLFNILGMEKKHAFYCDCLGIYDCLSCVNGSRNRNRNSFR